MTFDDLTDQCWADLPPLRKRLVGRDTVRQMLEDAVAEWDNESLVTSQSDDDLRAYESALVERVKTRRSGQEYGFVLLSIIATAVLVAVIQWLVKWWLDRNFNRIMLAGWQREMQR
jgi:hypothetical protein